MNLTVDQVLALAPDPSAATAGKKLGTPGPWTNIGASDTALWGECKGSSIYQVRADLSDLTTKCSCPSRKFPCKHGLGLLLLAATSPDAFPAAEPPPWVTDWLTQRAGRASSRAARASVAPDRREGASRTAAKRTDQRLARVTAGIEIFDRWLDDLIENGLATVETQPASFWHQQAARLVDAQAPGLATRVRRLATIPNASPDWPQRLLDELGRLALLTHAFKRLDQLETPVQEDVRAAIGWSLSRDDVLERGESVDDEWLVLGQRVTVEDRLRARHTWLLGVRSQRFALELQFAAGGAQFDITLLPGTRESARLTFWPGASPLRALVASRAGNPCPDMQPFPDDFDVARFLDRMATALAAQPWADRFPCVLSGIVPVPPCDGDRWRVRDPSGTLPLAGDDHWRLLALSGGRPVGLAGEWDGEILTPLGIFAGGRYFLIGEGR